MATQALRRSLSAVRASTIGPTRRRMSALAQKSEAKRTRLDAIPLHLEHQTRIDPYVLVSPELTHIRGRLLGMLGSAHPGLAEIAQYYFLHPSKQLRSLIVLLFSRATNGLGSNWEQKDWDATWEETSGRRNVLDSPLMQPNILNEHDSTMPDHTESFADVFSLRMPKPRRRQPPLPPSASHKIPRRLVTPPSILPTQLRLAQITEMIHIAFLLHGHIEPTSSEGQVEGFGNKLSILGGDYLLGRASTTLSHLGESEVVELVASVISNLVEGEFLGMGNVKTTAKDATVGRITLPEAWDVYMRQAYLKTASLMAKGARSAVILGGCQGSDVWRDVAYAYGRNLGIAHQLATDIAELKNLQPGSATGPILFAAEESSDIIPLIQRNFSGTDDIKTVIKLVEATSGVERTRSLSLAYAEKARRVLNMLPASDTRLALESLTEIVVEPSW